MSRVRLTPLPEYPFRTRLSVRTTDQNYAGHLGNDRLLSLLHEARMFFLTAHEMDEMDCDGLPIIQTETVIEYRRQAFAGDELQIEVAAGEPSRCSLRLFYLVTRIADLSVIAVAETLHIGFDYETEKIRPLSDRVRAICTARKGPGR